LNFTNVLRALYSGVFLIKRNVQSTTILNNWCDAIQTSDFDTDQAALDHTIHNIPPAFQQTVDKLDPHFLLFMKDYIKFFLTKIFLISDNHVFEHSTGSHNANRR